MNNKRISVLVMLIVIGIISAFIGVTWVDASQDRQIEPPPPEDRIRTVTVSGVGQTRAVPDIAIIHLGVETEAENAKDALDQNSEQMQSLMDALIAVDIPTEDIQTQTIQLTPRYEFDEIDRNRRTLIGYSAANFVHVEIRELQNLGIILDQAVSAGATTINSIRFEVSDLQPLAEQAREAAVANARQKAEQLADLTGVSLGTVVGIQEFSETPGPVREQVQLQAESGAVPIQPGTQTISIRVQITWQLEQ